MKRLFMSASALALGLLVNTGMTRADDRGGQSRAVNQHVQGNDVHRPSARAEHELRPSHRPEYKERAPYAGPDHTEPRDPNVSSQYRPGHNWARDPGFTQHGGSNRYKDYHVHYGKKFRYGYYYPGRDHYHWSRSYWSDRYGCMIYVDGGLRRSFYWCPPQQCYYPVTYCPCGRYHWDSDEDDDGDPS